MRFLGRLSNFWSIVLEVIWCVLNALHIPRRDMVGGDHLLFVEEEEERAGDREAARHDHRFVVRAVLGGDLGGTQIGINAPGRDLNRNEDYSQTKGVACGVLCWSLLLQPSQC